MNDKLKTKIFMMVILAGVLVLLGLTFVNSAFISAFMLWL